MTHSSLLLFLLGLDCLISARNSCLCLRSLPIGLCLSDFPRNGFPATPTDSSPEELTLSPIFLIGRLRNLDDYLTTVKLLLVERLDSLMDSLFGPQGNKSVSCGICTTCDNLNGQTGCIYALINVKGLYREKLTRRSQQRKS